MHWLVIVSFCLCFMVPWAEQAQDTGLNESLPEFS